MKLNNIFAIDVIVRTAIRSLRHPELVSASPRLFRSSAVADSLAVTVIAIMMFSATNLSPIFWTKRKDSIFIKKGVQNGREQAQKAIRQRV